MQGLNGAAAANVGNEAKSLGMFGFGYNRDNFKFDQGLRWQRYTIGRKMAMAQKGMFRQDVLDLATVTMSKMKIYAPIMTMSLGYCLTIFVEARSGLKFPGPPTFISGLYLQCLGVSFSFLTLGVWLIFHAAIRANIAAVSLRTRKVRVPVPTQTQLDGARKLLSTYEEQSLYDMFKLPLIMPNMGSAPEHTEETFDVEDGDVKGAKGKAAKGKKSASKKEVDKPAHGVRLPGTTKGNPTWIDKELAEAEANPNSSPDTMGREGESEPFEHFELMRQCQKSWWGHEAYSRICFLYGMMHLIQSFAYWLVIHNIAELGMVWCANVCAATLTAAVWSMFRLDVLASHGGCLPVEAGGPFVAAIAMAMMYTHAPTQGIIDVARALAAFCLVMQILWTTRLFIVAMPTYGEPSHEASESGGRLFNETASCQAPVWLPSAFQHVTYLIAPPKSSEALEQEKKDLKEGKTDDPMHGVDMTPWYYTRTLLLVVILGWTVLLAGRVVEMVMGERMLVSTPGAPPWTRIGQWYGWEFGPITSKHYAHVTPMKGHFNWQRGWGPQGQQEIWASDMFGFHPESDMWWAEPEDTNDVDPAIGAAGIGDNTWAKWADGVLHNGYHEKYDLPTNFESSHDFENSGGHRRLRGDDVMPLQVRRPVVPVAVQWPKLLEPEMLACGPAGSASGVVVALSSSGVGGVVPAEVAMGQMAGSASTFQLDGLVKFGMATGVAWAKAGLRIVTGSGGIATCPLVGPKGGRSECSLLDVPRLPFGSDPHVRATVVEAGVGKGPYLRVAAATQDGRVAIFELGHTEASAWQKIGSLTVPHEADGDLVRPEISAITASSGHMLVSTKSGSTYQWRLADGLPIGAPKHEAPSSSSDRTWWSACSTPSGKVVRLASNWKEAASGSLVWHPELFL